MFVTTSQKHVNNNLNQLSRGNVDEIQNVWPNCKVASTEPQKVSDSWQSEVGVSRGAGPVIDI